MFTDTSKMQRDGGLFVNDHILLSYSLDTLIVSSVANARIVSE